MWGEGGARMTPEEVARQRKVLDALTGRSDTSPVGHWTQGLARMTDSLGEVLKERRVNAAETQNRDASRSNIQNMIQALVGGGGGGGEQFPPAPGATSARPGTPAYADQRVASAHGADEIRHGLLQRGLPPHVAEAFVHNFMDESGLDPGINEREPLVPGSRGGFGLYQLTGPRRVAYEQFASQRGVDPADVDAQLDWLMHELQGPESRAAERILAAPDTATAAQAIVNDFLRPAANHRQARANRYASLASPEGMPATGAVNAFAGGEPAPPLGAPQEVPQLQVAQALTGQQMAPIEAAGGAGNMQAPGGGMGGINPQIIEALFSPYASEQERQIAGLLLNRHMEQQQAQQARQQQQQQLQAVGIDPNYAGIDPLISAAASARYRDDRTGDIKEFEYGQNTPGFYDHAERMARARGTQVNVNPESRQDPRWGDAPKDEAWAFGPDGEVMTSIDEQGRERPISVPIDSGATRTEQSQANIQYRAVSQRAGFALRDVRRINELIEQVPPNAVIRIGESYVPGSPSHTMERYLSSLKDSVAAMELIGMKMADTGVGQVPQAQWESFGRLVGYLGQDIEIGELQSIIEDLGINLSETLDLLPPDTMSAIARREIESYRGPAPREGGAPQQGQQGGPREIMSEEEYINLPSGAEFVAPDGSVRRKP